MSETDTIIQRLRDILDEDRTLAGRLEKSLVKARELANAELDPTVFKALQWPTDLSEYAGYLKRFIRWIPQESDPVSISDRLSHFYWLIDQKADNDEAGLVQKSDSFRDWLTELARQWGSILDTTDSFDSEILQSFRDRPEYELADSMIDGAPNMPSGWLTFNQFFARQLNGGCVPSPNPAATL